MNIRRSISSVDGAVNVVNIVVTSHLIVEFAEYVGFLVLVEMQEYARETVDLCRVLFTAQRWFT